MGRWTGVAGTRLRGMGLSTRITMLTFVSVTSAVALISAISLVGVYRSALSEEMARLDAYRTVVAGSIDARFTGAERALDAVASGLATSAAGESRAAATPDELLETHADTLDALVVVDSRGVEMPSDEVTGAPSVMISAVATATRGAIVTRWLAPYDGPGRLWVGRSGGEGTHTVTVIARVRDTYLSGTVDEVAPSGGTLTALVIDAAGRPVLVSAGSPPISAAGLVFSPDGTQTTQGTVVGSSLGRGGVSGSWEYVSGSRVLGWRVLVAEEDADALARSGRALGPALLAMLAVVLLAVLGALLYSRRLLGPLTVLEQRARDVAAGGYVRPVRVVRDDEMGRVAGAFNEMGVRLNSLQDMAQLLASASNLDDVLDAVLSALGRILGTGDAAVLLSDPAGVGLSLVRGRGVVEPAATLLVSLDEPSPFVSAFVEDRVVPFTGDAPSGAGSIYRLFGADPERAGVVVPLAIGREVIGVVAVLAPGRRVFTEAQIETLRVFSANAAVAVRTSRLFADERLSRTEAEALRSVAELTVRPGDVGHALDSAAAIAAELLGYRSWAVVLEGRQQLGLGLPVDVEADARLIDMWRMVDAGRPESEALGHAPVVIDDLRHRPDLAALTGAGWGSVLFIPVMQGSIARGALVLHDRMRRRSPSARQLAVAGTIGQQVSLTIRNAYLLQQARTRAANLETVFRISQAVSSELQVGPVLNRVLDVVQKILSADAVALMSYAPDHGVIETKLARGVTARDLLYFSARPGEDIPGRVFSLGMPLSYGDLSARTTPLARIAAGQGFESLLAVPLMARGRPIGVLAVYANAPAAFSGEDVELLLTFAAQAALAIDTAELYGKEHRVASVLQTSILPEQLPDLAGLETASFYLPSGLEAEIGGDYYDVFPGVDGRVVLAIGDVCGKGVAAATKTSMVKYTLRGLVGAGAGPGEALTELNRQVAATGDPADIVTMWVGMLDRDSGRLTFADGGHPAALLLRSGTREIERLDVTGPLLGAMARVRYEEREIDLGAGDMVLLYTDGITEARRGARLFGEGRVRRALRRATSARECLDLLLEAVKRHSAGPLRDDAAALAVRIVAEERGEPRVSDGT